ncbi:MAG: hypothetical protein H6510_14645 [Acidobacteria bacterium]|nr:hypothetical protein [Acidobacteriota bacterium]
MWRSKEVVVYGKLFGVNRHFKLTFSGVWLLEVAHEESWGPSNAIMVQNAVSNSEYVIQMQSGDEIKIRAKEYHFESFSQSVDSAD